MKDIVGGIQKFRFLMSVDPIGEEVTEKQFEDLLKSWPKASTYNYSNATVWRSPWMGEMKWVGMHHLGNNKYYAL